MLLKWKKMGCEGVEWANLSQDRDKRRAVVNTVMNFLVTQNVGEFLEHLT